MERELQRIVCMLKILTVTIFFIGLISMTMVRVTIDEAQEGYHTAREEVVEFVKDTKEDISEERKGLQELLDQLQQLQEGKIVTMKRDRGRYIISIEQKENSNEQKQE